MDGNLISGPITPREFFNEVAKGNVHGYSSISKFGENPDIDMGGFETIWDAGGLYVPPTIGRIHDIASDSVEDAGTIVSSGTATGGSLISLIDSGATFVTDSVAIGDLVLNDDNIEIGIVSAIVSETELTIIGIMRSPVNGLDGNANESGDAYRIVRDAATGAAVFHVLGLDDFFAFKQEFVVTNGTTNVPTVNTYKRQYRARVFASASAGAIGVIASTAQTDGTISCQIVDGNNQTLMTVYTIAANKVGMLVGWWARLSKKKVTASNVKLRVGILDGVGYMTQNGAVDNGGSSEFKYDWAVPLIMPGGADIWVEADSSANDVGLAAGFDMILIDKNLINPHAIAGLM